MPSLGVQIKVIAVLLCSMRMRSCVAIYAAPREEPKRFSLINIKYRVTRGIGSILVMKIEVPYIPQASPGTSDGAFDKTSNMDTQPP